MRCFFVAVKSKGGGLSAGGQVVHDEPEDGAFAQRALHAEAEAVLLEDGLGDGKAQPGALLAGVRTGAVVAVEDIGHDKAVSADGADGSCEISASKIPKSGGRRAGKCRCH